MGLFKKLFQKKNNSSDSSATDSNITDYPENDYSQCANAIEPTIPLDDECRSAYTPTPMKVENHSVAGTAFKTKEILSLAYENPEYDYTKKKLVEDRFMSDGDHEKIYKYFFSVSDIKLLPDMDNEYDKNAIKVIINGIHVGYIPKGKCSHVKNLIENEKIHRISADIYGGDYKLLSCIYSELGKETYTLHKSTSQFEIELCIYCHAPL